MNCKPLVLVMALSLPLAMAAKSLAATPAENSSKLSKSDKEFLKRLADEAVSEIHLANLALKRSGSAQVKQYAQSKILAAAGPMKDWAESIGRDNKVIVHGYYTWQARREYNKLAGTPDARFDIEYMKYEAQTQADHLKLVQDEAAKTGNFQVRSYARKQVIPLGLAAKSAQAMASTMSDSTPQDKG